MEKQVKVIGYMNGHEVVLEPRKVTHQKKAKEFGKGLLSLLTTNLRLFKGEKRVKMRARRSNRKLEELKKESTSI